MTNGCQNFHLWENCPFNNSIIINLLSIFNNFAGCVYTITDLKEVNVKMPKEMSQYTEFPDLCTLLVQYPKKMQHLKYALRVSEPENTGYYMTH